MPGLTPLRNLFVPIIYEEFRATPLREVIKTLRLKNKMGD
jgi:hypothetical protein